MYQVKLKLAEIARSMTGNLVLRKRLPSEFGRLPIFLTSRSDIRLLSPSWYDANFDLFHIVKYHISPVDIVWDIGANLGIFSFSAAWKVRQSGKVYSVEADSRHVELMYKTRELIKGSCAPVTILCAALSDKLACLDLNIVERGNARNYIDVVAGNESVKTSFKKTVISINADWLLTQWSPPTFLKVDIEGAELLFLRGAERILSQVRPKIYIEVNPDNQAEATKLLQDSHYQPYNPFSGEKPERIDKCIFNTLAIPEES